MATLAGSATPWASVEECPPSCSSKWTSISGTSNAPTILYLITGVHLLARSGIKVTFLVRGVTDTLNDTAQDLAFGELRIDRTPAIMDGDDAFGLHPAGLGVNGNFSKLHAADPVLAGCESGFFRAYPS